MTAFNTAQRDQIVQNGDIIGMTILVMPIWNRNQPVPTAFNIAPRSWIVKDKATIGMTMLVMSKRK